MSFCSARTSSEYKPCLKRARLDRAKPSDVFGPVLRPPCMRQRCRPLIAGDRHGVPRRVLAPQRGALFGSPGGFPFLSHPLRGGKSGSGGLLCDVICRFILRTCMAHIAYNRLAAGNIDITFNHHLLASPPSVRKPYGCRL